MQKEYRIKDGLEIENIIKGHKVISSKSLIIYYRKSETNHFRVAFSVSKKIGNAVVRNKQKRLLREAIRTHMNKIKPYDVFIIAKSQILNLDFIKLCDELYHLLLKVNIIEEKI